jgi:predicted transport protein
METLIQNNEIFQNWKYTLETDLEKRVKEKFKLIFGEDSLFLLLKKKIESSYGIKGIPDGFLIDFEHNKFFIVEIELLRHDFYEHILNQVTRFRSSLKVEKNKTIIAQTIYNSLKPEDKKRINSHIKDSEIFKYIHEIVFQENPGILVIIDEKTKDLQDLKEEYFPNLECIEFKTYKSKNKEIYKTEWFIREQKFAKKRVLKEYDRKNNLERANQEVHKTFEMLEAEILKLPNVKQKIGDHYFDFRIEGSKKGTFAQVNIRRDRLLIFIKMGKQYLEDPRRISSPVPKHWGYGDMTKSFSIDSKEDVDYAMKLIKQAYGYTKK